ncbi:MAG: hypothetical protein R3E53_08810 [Myxococcota bacterium]
MIIDHLGKVSPSCDLLSPTIPPWPGRSAERGGILKWGGKMYQAEATLANPKIHVTMRKAFDSGRS